MQQLCIKYLILDITLSQIKTILQFYPSTPKETNLLQVRNQLIAENAASTQNDQDLDFIINNKKRKLADTKSLKYNKQNTNIAPAATHLPVMEIRVDNQENLISLIKQTVGDDHLETITLNNDINKINTSNYHVYKMRTMLLTLIELISAKNLKIHNQNVAIVEKIIPQTIETAR